MLFCVSDDGSLFVFDVRDKDGRAKAGKEAAVVFAEEVLVTRSDLEEKKARMAELETQVCVRNVICNVMRNVSATRGPQGKESAHGRARDADVCVPSCFVRSAFRVSILPTNYATEHTAENKNHII
eukprot:1187664-Prorocentrum_minimum.AAC.2